MVAWHMCDIMCHPPDRGGGNRTQYRGQLWFVILCWGALSVYWSSLLGLLVAASWIPCV